MVKEVDEQIDREEAIIWPQIVQHVHEAEARKRAAAKRRRVSEPRKQRQDDSSPQASHSSDDYFYSNESLDHDIGRRRFPAKSRSIKPRPETTAVLQQLRLSL